MIPEDIDRHKPSSWEDDADALFRPEPRAREPIVPGKHNFRVPVIRQKC